MFLETSHLTPNLSVLHRNTLVSYFFTILDNLKGFGDMDRKRWVLGYLGLRVKIVLIYNNTKQRRILYAFAMKSLAHGHLKIA